MTDHCAPVPDQPTPRLRGRLGQWSDRIKALLLLSLLALTGAAAGWGLSGEEASRSRDGITAGGSGLRTALADGPIVTLQQGQAPAKPDMAGGGGDAPTPGGHFASPLSAPPSAALPVVYARTGDGFPHPRVGHGARMPTGPPARFSA